MKRLLKIILEIISGVILLAVVLPIFVTLILQTSFIQNFIASEFSKFATQKMGVEISVDRIYLKLFNKVSVDGFYVEDPIHRGDTLLYVKNVEACLGGIDFTTGKVNIDYANIDGGVMKLASDSTMLNIKAITNKLKPKVKKQNTRPFEMSIDNIKIDSFDFAYIRHTLRKVESGMNYTDMRFNSIKIIAEDFNLLGDSINMKLNHLRLTEKSGLHLSKITTDSLTLSSSKIAVKDADLRLDNSWVALRDFSLNYHDWTMSDFLDKVVMRATITDSHIEM
ncbi:MAG: hypothetical protein RR388_02655, partial [Rikenellaceae bacterium]